MDYLSSLKTCIDDANANVMCGWELNISTLIMKIDKAHIERLSLLGHQNILPTLNMLEYIERFVFKDDRELLKIKFLAVTDGNILSDRFFVRLINNKGNSKKFLLNLMVNEEGVLFGFLQLFDDVFLVENNFTTSASLRTILNSTKEGVFIVDERASLIEYNTQFAVVCKSLFNIELSSGIKFSDFIPGDLLAEFTDCFNRAFTNEHVVVETTMVVDSAQYIIEVTVTPILNDHSVSGVAFFVRDVTRLRKFIRIDDLENSILEQALRYQNIDDLFYSMLSGIESIADSLTCFLTKKRHGEMMLDWFSSVSIPEEYIQQIPSVPIKMNAGSCGTAAYLRKPVLVSDILTSSYWEDYRDYTLLTGYKACFSFPIINRVGDLIGTFGCYLKEARELSKFEYELLLRAVKLAGILLDNFNNEMQIIRQNEDIKEISTLMPGVLYKAELRPDGSRKFVYLGENFRDFFGHDPKDFLEDYDFLWKFVNKEDVEFAKNAVVKSIVEKTPLMVEMRVFNRDLNTEFWLKVSAIHKFEEDGSVVTFGNLVDITKLKEDEVELMAIVASMDDVVFLMDDEGNYLNVWSNSFDLLLMPSKEFVGKNIVDTMPAHVSDCFFNAVTSVRESGVEFEYEYSVEKNGELIYCRAKVGPILVAHANNRLYYSVQDISESKINQEKELKLKDIIKVAERLSKGGAWEYNINTEEVVWSDELYEIFNVSRAVVGKDLLNAYLNSLHSEDRTKQAVILARAIEAGVPFRNDHRIVVNGTVRWISSTSKVIHDDKGFPMYLRGFTQDISEIKEYQNGISKRDQIIFEVGNLGNIGGWEFDVNTMYLTWTDQMYKIYNVTTETIGESLFDLFLSKIHPEDAPNFKLLIDDAIANGKDYSTKHRVISEEGVVKYVKGSGFVQKDEYGRVVRLHGVCQDITELTSSQIAHRKDEELLQVAVDLGKIGAWSLNLITDDLVWSSEVYKIFEIDSELVNEELHNLYWKIVHPDDCAELKSNIDQLVNKGISYAFEHRLITQSGALKYVYCKADPIYEKNVVVAISGIIQDVTDRKNAEIEIGCYADLLDMIYSASVKLNTLSDQSAGVNILLEQIGKAIDVNRVYVFRSHNNSEDEIVCSHRFEWNDGSFKEEVDNFAVKMNHLEALAKGETVMGNVDSFSEDVQQIFARQNLKSLLLVPVKIDDNLWGYFGFDECRNPRIWKNAEVSFLKSAAAIIANAIKRETMQSALILSELTYSSLVDSMSEGVVLYGGDGNLITCNKSAEDILGMPLDAMFKNAGTIGGCNFVNNNGEILNQSEFPASVVLASGEPVKNFVMGILKSQQNECWISVNAEPIRIQDSADISGVAVTFMNVTEQLNSAKELNKLSAVARSTSNAVVITDDQFNVEWVNQGFESISGFLFSEVKSKKLFSLILEQNSDLNSITFIDECVRQQKEFFIERMFISKQGNNFFLHIEAQPIFNAKGILSNYILVGADITENKKNELVMSNSLKEKETLLAEIHHRVKNNLAVISSLFQLQILYSDDELVRSLLKESQYRLKSMALVHEKLYEGGDLSLVNFSQYITEVVDHIQCAYPVNSADVNVQFNLKDILLNIAQALPCALILNEVLTNCFKYAFVGRMVGTIVINFEEKGDYFLLEVIDDGIGFPANFSSAKVKSLGLTLIRTLTSQLKGSVDISSKNGTRVVITFPK